MEMEKHTMEAIDGLHKKYPILSIQSLNSDKILKGFLLFLILITALSYIMPEKTIIAVVVIINITYLITFFAKASMFLLGIFVQKKILNKLPKNININDKKLPVYSILIPLYREKGTVSKLLKSIYNFDYPKDKLDIKILLEEDDNETIKYIEQLSKKYTFDTIIVPNSVPKTKPKACNYGLQFAKGEFITIYDAEDTPKQNQLKIIINKFNESSKKLICVQAGLNYYNRKENLLTKMFAIEYSSWFDFTIKGLDYLKLPIPLGGTSNHFKTKKLREIGGWDAFNVTEDADLGIRIARLGYECSTVNTETLEEAPFTLKSWIKQRSRWIKGYIQTYFVHMQNPKQLYKDLGFIKFIAFQFSIGSTFFIFITLLPMLMFSILMWLDIINITIPVTFHYIAFLNLVISIVFMIFSSLYVAKYRRWVDMNDAILLFPFYWILHCVASFKSLKQLICGQSFYWEKTEHGKSRFISKQHKKT